MKTDKDIIKKLQSLKAVQPDADWKAHQKSFLLMQTVDTPIGESTTPGAYGFASVLAYLKQPQRVLSLAVFSIMLMLGGVVSVGASLPGDALYAVKRNAEKIQLRTTFSPEKKLALQMEFVEKRIAELNTLAQKGKVSKKDIHDPVYALQKDLEHIEESIPLVFQKRADQLFTIADLIDEKSEGYQSSLAAIQSNLNVQDAGVADKKQTPTETKVVDASLDSRLSKLSSVLENTKAKVSLIIEEIEKDEENNDEESKDESNEIEEQESVESEGVVTEEEVDATANTKKDVDAEQTDSNDSEGNVIVETEEVVDGSENSGEEESVE